VSEKAFQSVLPMLYFTVSLVCILLFLLTFLAVKKQRRIKKGDIKEMDVSLREAVQNESVSEDMKSLNKKLKGFRKTAIEDLDKMTQYSSSLIIFL